MRGLIKWSLIFSFIATPWAFSFAQRLPGGVVVGRISDSATGAPMEDALIFFANTSFGTSSAATGRFTFPYVPWGKYEVIVSRVDYDPLIVPVVITASDTFWLDVKLKPRPVTVSGVNVEASTPEIIKPRLFVPHHGEGIYCLYGNSMTPPIGILLSDDALYMVALEPTIIDSQKYVRLWLLYKNLSDNPCDFDPIRTVSLRIKGKDMMEQEAAPSFPGEMLPAVDTQQIIKGIAEEFGTTLQALATRRSAFEWEKYHSDLLLLSGMASRPLLSRPSAFPPARGGSLSASLYSTFRNSITVGILKRYLIYPENSVNGFVYFPFPALDWKATRSWALEASQYDYEVNIKTPNGLKHISFTPE